MKPARESVKEAKVQFCEERLKRLVRTGTKKQQERAVLDLLKAERGEFYIKNYKLVPKEAITIMEQFCGSDIMLYTTSGKFLVMPYEIKEV